MSDKEVLQSKRTDRETAWWIERLRDDLQKVPDRLEDAAKYIATMIGISLTLFLAIAKTGDSIQLTGVVKAAFLAWLLSLLFSFFVIFPFRYRVVKGSADSIQRMYRNVVRIKWALLLLSAALFLTSMSILVFKLI